ncbi:SPOR domain-containing protein [Flavobacterium facile]|uniref:SPOR domain-containing protein n=1 Tax=Flavobacterium facile TaxID=2893174 RepID=UPI002E77AD64|nr:SPOR domain-containing protein [Flavobacterium sp. T-12]
MKTLKNFTLFSFSLVCLLSSQNIFSQTKKSNIEQDEKIEKLLLEKRKNNSAITINDKFKIQIFFGNIEESKKTLIAFKKDFSQTDGTIIFSNPSYKVWVGSFKSKIEAEKALLTIKKKYTTAVLIEPNKK